MSDSSAVLAVLGLGAGEMLLVVGVAVLFFGAARIPKLARSLGQASNEFQKAQTEGETKTGEDSDRAKNESKNDDPKKDGGE